MFLLVNYELSIFIYINNSTAKSMKISKDFSIHIHHPRRSCESNGRRESLSMKVSVLYLLSVELSDFRPNRIKVPIDEFRQKAERNSFM